jgi:hypothetical protein
MVSESGARRLSMGTFTRGDTVVLMDKALKTEVNGKKSTLANNLQREGVIDREMAIELNVLPDISVNDMLTEIGDFITDKFE